MITDEQREARKAGLFSSDMPRVMMGQRVQVALEKMGLAEPADLSEIDYVQLGVALEERVIDAFLASAEDHVVGMRIAGASVWTSPPTIRHPRERWMGCHMDAAFYREHEGRGGPRVIAPIEAKVVGAYNRSLWGEPGTDEVPERVMWQVQAQMACTESGGALVPVAFADEKTLTSAIVGSPLPILVYRVARSDKLIDHMIERGRELWARIERGELPQPESATEAIKVFRRDSGDSLEVDGSIAGALAKLAEIRARTRALEAEDKALSETIKAMFGPAAQLTMNGVTLATYKNDADGAQVDVDALKRRFPHVYEAVLAPRPGVRRLLLKEKALAAIAPVVPISQEKTA